MLRVDHLTLTHSADLRVLIRDLSFTLAGSERLAVIGEEGDGKSALLKALCDPEALSGWAAVEGSVSFAGETPAYLPQEAPPALAQTPVYSLCLADPGFAQTEPGELNRLCRSLSLEPALCWAETPFGLLSGGEKVKLRLLMLLCGKPSMLILDEPGNDLDLAAITALERFLLDCGLPVLYVSHDEALLRATATQVLHLESLRGRSEPRWTWARTPYAAYVSDRRDRLDRQESQWQAEQRENRIREEKFRRIEEAVDRAQANISRQDPHGGRLLKKKMKAVKSLEHRYEREKREDTERPWEEYAMFAAFHDVPPQPAGRTLLSLSLPELRAEDRVLARNVSLRLRGPEKVLITGPNGCGKTTLLRAAEAQLRAEGRIAVGVMPQRYEDVLDPEQTPLDFLHVSGEKEQRTWIRTALGAMKLTQDEITHPIRGLSGGQKAKVLLMRLMLAKPELLLMDEPTRNLSPLSAPVMRELLTAFPGAVLCVTHDRVLMADWPGRVLRLTPEGLEDV